jgi:hypothetical protein
MTPLQLHNQNDLATLALVALIAWAVYGLTAYTQNRPRYKRKGNR